MRRLLIILFIWGVAYGQNNPTSLTIQKDLRVQGQTVLGGVAKERDITMTADTIRIKNLDGTGTLLTIDVNGDVVRGTAGAASVTGLNVDEVLFGKSDGTIEQSANFKYVGTELSLSDGTDFMRIGDESIRWDKGANYTAIYRASGGSSYDLYLPNAQGAANTFLQNDGSGNLSWAAGGGGSYTFSTGLTDAAGTVTANLSTGISGGQSVIGGTAASNNLTLSSTSNATKGKLLFGSSAYDENNNFLGIQNISPTSKLQVNHDANSPTPTDADGFLLANATAATAGTQSASPSIVLQGNGWKTNATAGSQDVRFRMYTLPVQGAANPSGELRIQSSIDGSAYASVLRIASNGLLTVNISNTSTVSTANQFRAGLTTSASGTYRTTNGGSNITPYFTSFVTSSAGDIAINADNTNGYVLSAGNGSRQIARAGINITNLTNTAGAESGDLAFYTQSGGTAMSEKMRIFAGGNIGVNTTTNAGYNLDVNGTGRFQTDLTTPKIIVNNSTETTSIERTAGGSSYTVYLPNAQGGANTYLKNDGSGNLSWAAAGGSYTFSTGLTDAAGTITSNLSTGISGGQSVIGGTAASENLTLSSTANATKGKILFGTSAYDEANNRLGIQQASPTSKLQVNHDANSVTINDADGLLLANATAAISGTQSASPALILQGNGWKTTAPAASQYVRFRMYVLPVQSTSQPSGTLVIQSDINSTGYANRATLSSSGFFQASSVSGNVVSASQQILGGASSSSALLYRTTNGGSDILPQICTNLSVTSGAIRACIDNTNGFILNAGNGTRSIARAAINITNLTNTAGSESGDLQFLTQSGGTAISEKMRIFAAGNVAINTTTNAGFKFDVNGTGRFQSELTTTGNLVAYTSKTGAYTATSTDETIAADATTAAFQVTLPTASGRTGQRYTIKKTDSSANAVTVGTTSSQTIDGSTTYSLATQWKYVTVVSNGSNWLIISNN